MAAQKLLLPLLLPVDKSKLEACARRLIKKHGYWRRDEELEDSDMLINKNID